jgi:hypothetical protein
MHGHVVVQNLVDLDAPLFEFRVKAILQVGLVEPPVLVVAVFRKDLPNVVPFYIFTAVNKVPWLRYLLLASKGQLLRISKDMQLLPLNGTPPFPIHVYFFFTKFCFGLLALAVHGFLNLLPIGSLKNSNSILLKGIFNTFTIYEALLNVLTIYQL